MAHFGGPGWLDLFLQRAADKVIVQVEKIVPNEEVRAAPWATTIADAVIRCPFGAQPYYSRGFYVQDRLYTKRYVEAAEAGGAALDDYLARFVTGPETHGDYLELVGVKQLLSLHEY